MRGRTEFGGKATPGAMPASMMNSAAVQRQLHDLLVLDDRPEARGLRSHDRRITDDRHLFAHIADAEVEIDACLFASRETNALAPHGFEPWELDVEAVVAGRQARGGIDAIATGDGDSLKIRPCVGDRDRRAGNSRPGLIFHNAGDLARTRLSTGWQHADKPGARHRKADRTQSPSIHTDDVLGQVGPCFSLAPDLGPLRPKMTNRTPPASPTATQATTLDRIDVVTQIGSIWLKLVHADGHRHRLPWSARGTPSGSQSRSGRVLTALWHTLHLLFNIARKEHMKTFVNAALLLTLVRPRRGHRSTRANRSPNRTCRSP